MDGLAQFLRGGEATVDVVETYSSGDLAVLVVIDRQHGTVGDLLEQDWSLRVTWVFRRTAEPGWELCTAMQTRSCIPSIMIGWEHSPEANDGPPLTGEGRTIRSPRHHPYA